MPLALGVAAGGQSNSCRKAVAPVVVDIVPLDIAALAGDTPAALHTVASGSPAVWGGQILNSGCDRLKVDITYLDGDDCDPCTNPDTLTTVVITQFIEKDVVGIQIPEGYWTNIDVTVVDAAGAATPSVNGTQVTGGAAWNPGCTDCVVMVP